MVYTFCTNIFIKNTNLWHGQRRAGRLDTNIGSILYKNFILVSRRSFI